MKRKAAGIVPDNVSTALNILKDVAETLENVPYIKSIAGLSVQILEIRKQIASNEDLCYRVIGNVASRSTTLVKALIRAQENSALDLQDLVEDLERYEKLLVEIQQGLLGLTSGKLGWLKAIVRRGDIKENLDQYLSRLNEFDSAFMFTRLTTLEINVRRVVERDASEAPPVDSIDIPAPTHIFTGREDVLETMQSYFSATDKRQRIFVLYGLGGSGKTQICLKFLEQHRERFSKIFLVQASSIEDLQSSFQKIGSNAKLRDSSLAGTLRWLSNLHEDWLLLFDNADDPSIQLRQFIPQCPHGNVLVTSRNPHMRRLAPESHFHVAELSTDDALALLTRSSMLEAANDDEKQAANKLVEELGYLALAIVQAGSFISASPTMSFQTYTHLYKDNRTHFLSRNPGQGVDGYEGTVYTTWEMSFEKLSDTAARLLQICAFWDPRFIILRTILVSASSTVKLGRFPRAWADAADFVSRFSSGTDKIWNELAFQDVIRELSSFSLISLYDGLVYSLDPLIFKTKDGETSRHQSRSEDQGVYSIHPLVHAWARDRASPEEREQFRLVAGCILGMSMVLGDEDLSITVKRSVAPQVREWLHLAPGTAPLDLDLWQRFAEVYSELGWWEEAESLRKSLLEVIPDQDSPQRLDNMMALGLIYHQQQRWAESLEHELRVLELSKRLLGDEHRTTLSNMGRLSAAYANQKAIEEAEELELEVFQTSKRLFGEQDPLTITTMSNLGLQYAQQKRFAEAEELQSSALEIMKTVFGERNWKTLTAMHNLASTYCSQGRWTDALELQLFVAERRTQILGWEHPDSVISIEHLASTYCDLEVWEEAEPLQLLVVSHQKEALGGDDLRTLVAMSNLAVIYFKEDKFVDAERVLEDVVTAKKRVLGEDHPSTGASITALENVREAKESS